MTASAFSSLVIANSPEGYWKNTEQSGTKLIDHSGNSRHADWVGVPNYSDFRYNLMGEKVPFLSGNSWARLPSMMVKSRSGCTLMMVIRHERDLSPNNFSHLYLAEFCDAGEANAFIAYVPYGRIGYYGLSFLDFFGGSHAAEALAPSGRFRESLVVMTIANGDSRIYEFGRLVGSKKHSSGVDAVRSLCSLFKDAVDATSVDTRLFGYGCHVALFNRVLPGDVIAKLFDEYTNATNVASVSTSAAEISVPNRFSGFHCPSAPTGGARFSTSGMGVVQGGVTVAGKPVRRLVRLVHAASGLVHQTVWSGDDGRYRFNGVSTSDLFCVMSHDHDGKYNAVVADNVYAELK